MHVSAISMLGSAALSQQVNLLRHPERQNPSQHDWHTLLGALHSCDCRCAGTQCMRACQEHDAAAQLFREVADVINMIDSLGPPARMQQGGRGTGGAQ